MFNKSKTDRDMNEEIKRISNVVCEVIGLDQISPKDNFFDLGADSFDAIRIASRLEENLQIISIFEHPTAEKLAEYLLSNVRRDVQIVTLQDNQKSRISTALIGVPYGGGDPTAYRDIFTETPDLNVYGVDFGDFHIEETQDFSALVDILIKETKKINADHYIIYGHCAGAATAACIASVLGSFLPSMTLIIAAAKPVTDPDAAWQEAEHTSNDEWGVFLRSLGAFDGLSDLEADGMLERGRRDHRISVEAYRTLSQSPKSKVPTLILLGDLDQATPNHEEVINEWSKHVEIIESVNISGGGHYFLRTHNKMVEDFVLSFSSKNREGLHNENLQ